MKTNLFKACLLTVALSLGTMGMRASENNPVNPALKEASKMIGSSVKLPEEYRKAGTNMRVTVFFSVDANGQINKAVVKGGNAELKQTLEKQFIHMQLSGLSVDSVYSIVLHFKTLQEHD